MNTKPKKPKKMLSLMEWTGKLTSLEDVLNPPEHLKDLMDECEEQGWQGSTFGEYETAVSRYNWKKTWFEQVSWKDWLKVEEKYPRLVKRMESQLFKGSYVWDSPLYMVVKNHSDLFDTLMDRGVSVDQQGWQEQLALPTIFFGLLRHQKMKALSYLKEVGFENIWSTSNQVVQKTEAGWSWNQKVLTQILIKDDLVVWNLFKNKISKNDIVTYRDRQLNPIQMACYFHSLNIVKAMWEESSDSEKMQWPRMEDEFGQSLVALAIKGIKTVVFMKDQQNWAPLSEEQFTQMAERFTNMFLWLRENNMTDLLPSGWIKPKEILQRAGGVQKSREFKDVKLKDKTPEDFMMRVVIEVKNQAILKQCLLNAQFKPAEPLLDEEGGLMPTFSRKRL